MKVYNYAKIIIFYETFPNKAKKKNQQANACRFCMYSDCQATELDNIEHQITQPSE